VVDFQVPIVHRQGDTSKTNPFTILVVANPVLEIPWKAGKFGIDPITHDPTRFAGCVQYIEKSVFGARPNQAEGLLGDTIIAPKVRFLSLFQRALPPESKFSFVAEDFGGGLLVPRRRAIRDFLQRESLLADIVYVVSASVAIERESAWATSDDDKGPGTTFLLDGKVMSHRHNYLIPGTIALHLKSDGLTAAHEFHHAISSYSNGLIQDLYIDSPPAVNVKCGRPIPSSFGDYESVIFGSDSTRMPLLYPTTWNSYHCERHDGQYPALMDDYWKASGGISEVCQNDKITRKFVLDRVRAKISR
jgi:hypothetical protein